MQGEVASIYEFLKTFKDDSNTGNGAGYLFGQIENSLIGNVLIAPYRMKHPLGTYDYLDKNIFHLTGYTAEEYIARGVQFTMSRICESEMYLNEFIPYAVDFTRNVGDDGLYNWHFSVDYRFLRADDTIAKLHQKLVIVERDENKMPKLEIGLISDISHMSFDENIIFSATHIVDGRVANRHVKVFAANKAIQFSDRELDVLMLMHQGYSSKQIAAQLNISVNTVNNHRSNMLLKTKAKNTAELIRLGVKQGVL